MTDLPTVITEAGLQVTAPATLRANTVTYAEAASPGITTDLPGTLIEDLASTATGALVQIDQARVDAVNSITPYGCNVALLDQLGAIYGITRGGASNTSCYVQFSGTPGFVINSGLVVSDGTYQYATQSAAIIGTDGTSGNVYVIATTSGSWAIPEGTITEIVTSIPSEYNVTVNNAATGVPGSDAESDTDYRYRIIQSGAISGQSTPRYIKSLIGNVSGVNSRLISIKTLDDGYQIMASGGDPYEIANAIYQGCFDLYALRGSENTITSVSKESSAVITTELTHGLSTGASVTISGAEGITAINGTFTATVLTANTFSIPVNTSSASDYTGGGILETNPRNEVVTIIDGGDTYSIPFVTPLQQIVKINLIWNTNADNTVSSDSVVTAGRAALVSYINGIYAGSPINLFELQAAFQTAVTNLVPAANLTRMVFTVYIDGVEVDPETGTGIIQGDAQSYLYTTVNNITITRG